MSSLKNRVNKLHMGAIGEVGSQIVFTKDNKIVRKLEHGNNKEKIIRLVVRF